MTVNDLHKEAMRFQELAIKARKNELQEESLRNFAKAFEFEKQAFILFNSQSQEEPTRSILLNPTWPEIGDFWAKSTFFQLFLVISA